MGATWMLLAATLATADVQTASRLLDDWQLEDALSQSMQLLADDADDAQAQLLAAEVLHQRGEHLMALPLMNAAGYGAGPRYEMLKPMLEGSASYASGFHEFETPHFKVHFIDKDEIMAAYALPVIEAAYKNIGGDLGFLPAERGEKIVVEIYPDARGLALATGLTLKEIETSGTIAVCKYHRLMLTSPLATADGYAWADTVAHEFTHLVVSKKSRNTIPIWLHEGIAKYYESRWKGPAGKALTPYGEKLLADAVRTGKYITFQQMHPSMAKLPSQEAASLAFAEVFTVIEFLSTKYGNAAIAKVLQLCGERVPLEKALQQAFGMDLNGIEKAWKQYLQKRPFKDVPHAAPEKIRLATDAEDTKKERPLEPMQEDKEVHDMARLGELLQLRGQGKAAVVEYQKAFAKAGMKYPTLIDRLARALAETDRAAEALKLLRQELALHPEDSDAQLLAGRLCLKQENWPEAREHFEAARLQNPFNPEIHAALAALYKAGGAEKQGAQEQHFLELSQVPRQQRTFDLPTPSAAEARLNIVTYPWGEAHVDGGSSMPTPAWAHPVSVGAHEVRFSAPGGKDTKTTVQSSKGEDQTVILR